MENVKNIFESVKRKHLVTRVMLLVLSLLLAALIYNLFERPLQIVTGGSTGISIITEYLFGIKPSLVVFIISISTLIISFIFLGFEKTSSAILSSFLFPVFVDLTSNITNYIKIDTSDMFLMSIFIGVATGIYSGIILKAGFSNGGISTISHILYKYKKISITSSSLFINLVIVLIGGALFGINKVMYAVIILYIYSIVANKVLLGTSRNKNIFIITNKFEEMRSYIINDLNCGLTEFDVKGGISFNKRKVLMTAVANNDYFILKEGARHIDKDVFFIVTDSYQLSGDE